ncbi:MAG: hypothetical protein A2882_05725 [Phenylobacterium sp. RIFCSPHIGHO2_01_FULL_70_10]|nr:MAG: hypothetical protein A2882_05725 [Phenylobacterium sp. RIFCSPHIGHO2_01_FULL_70_10]
MGFSDDLKKMLAPYQQGLEILQSMQGEQREFQFDPYEDASIEAAIAEGYCWIDDRLGTHMNNPVVGAAAASFKEQLAQNIRQRAEQLRAR